jgi:hypothetical protein
LFGDLCVVNVIIDHETKFILGAVYIHPNVPQDSIEYFRFQMLGAFSEAIKLIFPSMNHDTETPILLCGDFKTDVMQNKSFVNFYEIQVHFGLQEFRVHNSRQYMHRANIHYKCFCTDFTICIILLVLSTCSEQINVK